MDRTAILEKLQEIFIDLLDNEDFEITPDLKREDLEDWDSLFQITLMAAVADEFKIKLSTDDIAHISGVEDLIKAIEKEL